MSNNRMVAAIVALVVLVGAGVGIAMGADSTSSPKSKAQELSAAEANKLAERLQGDRGLAREGVFVELADPAVSKGVSRCVRVQLLNPTIANRQYLSRQYGDKICVSSTPIGPSIDADTCGTVSSSAERVEVPDLIGLAPTAADKRARSIGLRLGGCDGRKPARKPDRYSPDNALLVTQQCPQPGTRVPTGSGVAVHSEGRLPGGYRVVGTADYGNARPCK
jgi:hypothetical protein